MWLSPSDPLTVGQCCEGTAIFGATGSGKSSGSGRALAQAFLRAGWGGLVLTVKPDEAQNFFGYAAECGRLGHVIPFSPRGSFHLDFLDYECRRPGGGAGITENIAQLLLTLLELSERKESSGGGERYWARALKQLLRNAIDLRLAARGSVSMAELQEVVRSAPQSPQDLESVQWRETSLCFHSIAAAEARNLTASQKADFEHAARFFLSEWPFLADRTKSVVVSSLTGVLDVFLRGVLRDLFCCGRTNVIPELAFEGAILVVDLPVKVWGELGQYAQVLVKDLFQRAMERRNVTSNPRPVFLWMDEFQNFCVERDALFQATARSARFATVALTQNLPGLYSALGGGEAAKNAAHALLGNLLTKVLHANSDPITNEWSSELFAKTWQYRMQVTSGTRPSEKVLALRQNFHERTAQAAASEQLEAEVLPVDFSTLRKGGPPHFHAEALVYQGGRTWEATGRNWLRVLFPQT